MERSTPTRTITLHAAQFVVEAAIAAATQLGCRMCVCVVDPGGHQVAAARMDGAMTFSIEVAADKAWSVAATGGVPTEAWWGAIKDEPALVHGISNRQRLAIFGGGVALRDGEVLIGAVGCSGGSAQQDHAVAAAAASALASAT